MSEQISISASWSELHEDPLYNYLSRHDYLADLTFLVDRTGDLSSEAWVYYVVSGSGVTVDDVASGDDYSGMLHFAAGDSRALLHWTPRQDGVVEGNETFVVSLGAASLGYDLGVASAKTLLVNDDHPVISGGSGADMLVDVTLRDSVQPELIWTAATALYGQGGADTLNGVGGADSLFGGAGDDLLISTSIRVDAAGDGMDSGDYWVNYVEWFDGGDAFDVVDYTQFDRGYSTGHFSNAHNDDGVSINLASTGQQGDGGDYLVSIEGVIGSPWNDLLLGNAVANRLVGGAGADTLDGAAGADTLDGGSGDDVFYVDNMGDQVREAAGAGFDTVFTSNTFIAARGSSIEKIIVQGAGNVAVTGNGHAIEIVGGTGVNTLDDGGGAATLRGGSGNDVYVVHNALSQVIEVDGEGYDTVKTDLSTYTLGSGLDVIIHVGSTAFQGVGNALNNALVGGGGADTLNGGGGNDVLTGADGADSFIFGGAGFGVDIVTDFVHGLDRLALSGTGLGITDLANVVLVSDDAAVAVGQAALHYYASGGLSFDPTGGSLADAIVLANLQGHPGLSASDFVLV